MSTKNQEILIRKVILPHLDPYLKNPSTDLTLTKLSVNILNFIFSDIYRIQKI